MVTFRGYTLEELVPAVAESNLQVTSCEESKEPPGIGFE